MGYVTMYAIRLERNGLRYVAAILLLAYRCGRHPGEIYREDHTEVFDRIPNSVKPYIFVPVS